MARSATLDRLIEALARLPGVGPKTSERLAFFLLRDDPEQSLALSRAIEHAVRSTCVCSRCFNLDDVDPCRVCTDGQRDGSLVLVVEDPRDLGPFDEAGYRGLYHVLQGRVSNLEGIGPGDLTVDALIARVAAGGITEVCLATNPDLEGEATARMIADRLAESGVAITRLARGLPAGSSIGQVSSSIIADAIEGRRRL